MKLYIFRRLMDPHPSHPMLLTCTDAAILIQLIPEVDYPCISEP